MGRHYFERSLRPEANANKCVECGQDRHSPIHIIEDKEESFESNVTYTNKRAEILQNAEQMINGPRADTYGHPSVNFGRIAAMWNAAGFHISLDGMPGRGVNATDVALAMMLVKAARLVTSPDHEDSWTDAAGYAGIGGELGVEPKEGKSLPEKVVIFTKLGGTRKQQGRAVCSECQLIVQKDGIEPHMDSWHPEIKQYQDRTDFL